jgi:hypothetical protein
VLNTIVGYDTYSFLDGYSWYHQISITQEDRYKAAFVIDVGAFIWKVMSFGVKIGPPTYQSARTKSLREYLDSFMKIFLDDFTMYTNMESHFQKLKLCFQKCKENGIKLNLNIWTFIVFSWMILGFIVFKEGKLPYPKKIQAIVKMPQPKNPWQI